MMIYRVVIKSNHGPSVFRGLECKSRPCSAFLSCIQPPCSLSTKGSSAKLSLKKRLEKFLFPIQSPCFSVCHALPGRCTYLCSSSKESGHWLIQLGSQTKLRTPKSHLACRLVSHRRRHSKAKHNELTSSLKEQEDLNIKYIST